MRRLFPIIIVTPTLVIRSYADEVQGCPVHLTEKTRRRCTCTLGCDVFKRPTTTGNTFHKLRDHVSYSGIHNAILITKLLSTAATYSSTFTSDRCTLQKRYHAEHKNNVSQLKRTHRGRQKQNDNQHVRASKTECVTAR